MWSLDQLLFDADIPGDTVWVWGEGPTADDPSLEMNKAAAIALAQSRGLHLVAQRPSRFSDEPVDCSLSRLELPPRWERHLLPHWEVDEKLWFVGSCGKRDFLVGTGHTFQGRMSAWCPDEEEGYSISKNEIVEMSTEASYWIKGFLHGNEPDPPYSTDSYSEDDQTAWEQATARFRRSGEWLLEWNTCNECGCVLLPGVGERGRCVDHPAEAAGVGA